MKFIHLRRSDFGGYINPSGLCIGPDGVLFASGYIGPLPEVGNLLRIMLDGTWSRIGEGLRQSYSIAFDQSTGTLIVSANDGTITNRPSAPDGLFRITVDGTRSVITRVTTGSGLPVTTDPAGNVYYPGVDPEMVGSILRRSPAGNVEVVASGFLQIASIAADEEGNLFVADAESYAHQGVLLFVPRRNSEKRIRVLVSEDGIRPRAVAAGKNGSAFFSNARGENGDRSEIYRVDPNGQITLVVDGMVQAPALAYDAKNDVLYALNVLNFVPDNSAIPKEYVNDTLILSMKGEGHRLPAPFHQASSPLRLNPAPIFRKSNLVKATTSLDPTGLESDESRASMIQIGQVSSYVAGSGPAELARAILEWRGRILESYSILDVFLSERAVERLIDLAYHASCLEEEGRFPRFRILAGIHWGSQYGVEFGPFATYIDQAKDLRKLAPAAAFRGSAVLINEEWVGGEHRRLVCQGIYDTEELISIKAESSGSIEDFLIIRQPVLVVRIEGPAYLKASFLPGPVFSLRGGTIRQLNTVETISDVQMLFSEIGEWQHAQLPEGDDKRVRTFFKNPDVLGNLMARMWSRVLWHVSERRRGGAFVIVPRYKGHWRHAEELEIALSYRASVNLGSALISQIVSCLESTSSSEAGYGHIFRLTWDRSRTERERVIRMVADLANVDGCVVLDRRLNVVGFGGKIKTSARQMEGFGTRHASARAWASSHAGGIVFVVSQDGDLRVFSGASSSRPDVVDAGASILELC